jgi:hypothetical protein
LGDSPCLSEIAAAEAIATIAEMEKMDLAKSMMADGNALD